MTLLELASLIGVEGFLHPAELDKLVELACNRDVLEVGAYRGLSAWGMAITAKSVTSIDTFSAATNGQRQTGALTTLGAYTSATDRYRYATPIIGTSEAMAWNTLLKPFYDLIFIDANHEYNAVKADIQRWWPRLAAGGIFACHDFGHGDFPGVQQAVDEVLGPLCLAREVVGTLIWMTKT